MRCHDDAGASSMKLDQWGNLFFMSIESDKILMIRMRNLEKVFNLEERQNMKVININVTCEEVYTSETTKYIEKLSGIVIERDYIYWSNSLDEKSA